MVFPSRCRSGYRDGPLPSCLHRSYYGLSQPFDDLSTANMAYLTSEQVRTPSRTDTRFLRCFTAPAHCSRVSLQSLADHASLHAMLTAKYSLSSANKWVSFGGSYSGALSAWMRLKVRCFELSLLGMVLGDLIPSHWSTCNPRRVCAVVPVSRPHFGSDGVVGAGARHVRLRAVPGGSDCVVRNCSPRRRGVLLDQSTTPVDSRRCHCLQVVVRRQVLPWGVVVVVVVVVVE